MDGGDGRSRQFGGNIGGDDRQAENLDMKCFAGRPDPLEIRPGEVAQAKLEVASRDGLLHRVGVTVELGADRRSNEVRTIGIESLRTSRSIWPRST